VWANVSEVAVSPSRRYNNCNPGAAAMFRTAIWRRSCRRKAAVTVTEVILATLGGSIRTVSTESDSEREPLRLDQFLKLRGIADTGGQAKLLIQNGDVQVNGAVETRRRRKLVIGDVVEVGGIAYSPDERLSGS
jgi:ribosome-associated protein